MTADGRARAPSAAGGASRAWTGVPAGPCRDGQWAAGGSLRHSIGELLTCPFRLDVWISAGLTIGWVFAPRPTRLVAATFTALTGADLLQPAYARAQRAAS